MLVRYDPFRQLDRLNGDLFGNRPARPRHSMPMDAVQHGNAVELRFDLPGVSPDSVDVTVERQVLTVTAERSWTPAEGDTVITRERPHGSVSRQVTLAETLDTDHLEAHFDAGVLTVTIPVAEQAKARKVEIHTGRSSTPPRPSTPKAFSGSITSDTTSQPLRPHRPSGGAAARRGEHVA